ncbi:hypothetical protein NADFUDRAFT_52085 [Nadsonia fulvescens var. elongata DSM 6958]|uniref:Zn(2)-C6 fungal-type domain-containing protein n=1 Tax=Nadsonia fulvescens var. elongata DSM 6958 TaxID=857566 RepID=A0A1E3PKY4_9ASCO|nr:hypothetical protein NADFUDRAFT_52085 [Nadsonia fulvescens var. elongata DSM 6958]
MKATRQSSKRSRNGCLSCNSLRIKCDEAKLKCEYCAHTNKECIYNTYKEEREDQLDHYLVHYQFKNYEDTIKDDLVLISINSMAEQLNISYLELRLLIFLIKHGCAIFYFNRNQAIDNVWRTHVPQMLNNSQLMRDSILSASALQPWALNEELDIEFSKRHAFEGGGFEF